MESRYLYTMCWIDNTNIITEAHLPTPPYGHNLTHAHNHITRAVAAMDNCFALIRANRCGIAVESMSRRTLVRAGSPGSVLASGGLLWIGLSYLSASPGVVPLSLSLIMAIVLLSLNVCGLRGVDKRAGLLKWICSLPSPPDIICSAGGPLNVGRQGHRFQSSGYRVKVSAGSNRSCGCAATTSFCDDEGPLLLFFGRYAFQCRVSSRS